MTIVADHYQHVIGVDTHAATHAMNVVTAATRAPGAPATFPVSAAGLDRARDWIARSVLSIDLARLRTPRADGPRVAMRVLVVAREQMTCERTRAINALTALVRTVDLGIDARKPLAHSQISTICA